MDTAVVIEEFPDYSIDRDGTVYSLRNGARRRPSLTREGAVKIGLSSGGYCHTRSVALLVAKAHLYNDHDPLVFDTPIHLDNDLTNNHVDNLAWRPRWFAIKYQKQYWHENFRNATSKIEDIDTGEIWIGFKDLCQRYGILYHDVFESCLKGTYVFPTWKTFRFVDKHGN